MFVFIVQILNLEYEQQFANTANNKVYPGGIYHNQTMSRYLQSCFMTQSYFLRLFIAMDLVKVLLTMKQFSSKYLVQ